MANVSPDYGTVLGPDAKFKGDLSFDSAAKVLGRFEGSIKSKGRILIADGSTCKASVAAKEVAIEGQIEGNVEATERIELSPSGKITGDIVASRMSMADGATIDGHVRIGLDSKEGTGKAASTAEPKVAAERKPVEVPERARSR
jgi:cytoskeletal protein CcmA (bactofilin family)